MLEVEAEGVRREEPLGRDLRRRVERRLDGERRVLRRRASRSPRRRPTRSTRTRSRGRPRPASPRARSASRRTFCSMHWRGASRLSLMSAFAARWNTKSTPRIASSMAAWSSRSPSTKRRLLASRGEELAEPRRDMLSNTVTRAPRREQTSTTWLPMKPAPPVTRTCLPFHPENRVFTSLCSSLLLRVGRATRC